LISQKNF